MAEFAYNNAKNASTGYTLFELNCSYHPHVSYKKDMDPCSRYKSADNLASKLRELMVVCRENFQHAQDLQKQANNKIIKPRSYAANDKVWLNSKYIKTKQNRKLEAKFFGRFQVLHPVEKQAYKLKPLKKWKIYDVFHVSLLKQDTIRKGWTDENMTEFEAGNNKKEYEVEGSWDNAVYAQESAAGQLPGLYYMISWKGYSEEKNTWKPVLTVEQLPKLIPPSTRIIPTSQ